MSTSGIAIISHHQHAERLFQPTPCDQLILSNSWASFNVNSDIRLIMFQKIFENQYFTR